MMEPQVIELHAKDEWRDGYRDHFKEKEPLCIINELCGSLAYERPLELIINTYNENNLIVANNCPGVNSEDVTRLNKFSSGSHKKSKKGDSIRGVGTRCVLCQCSTGDFPDFIDEDFEKRELIGNFSFMISRVTEDINIPTSVESEESKSIVNRGGYLLYAMDRDFRYYMKQAPVNLVLMFNDLFKTMNTVFVCPFENISEKLNDPELTYGLRILFNRIDDCSIKVLGENILKDKKYKLFDKKRSTEMRYIDATLKVYENHRHIGHLEIIDSQNVDIQSGYYRLNSTDNTALRVRSHEDWCEKDCVIEGGEECIYECTIRLHSVDNEIDNHDYKDYYGVTCKGNNGNGILPYINSKCIRSNFPLRIMGNNRMHPWMEGIPKDRPTTRDFTVHNGEEVVKYVNGQYWQAELQETDKYDESVSIISKEIEKMESEIKKDSVRKKQTHYGIPYLINHLIKEYIWEKASGKDPVNVEESETLQQVKEKAKDAEIAKNKAEAEFAQVQEKLRLTQQELKNIQDGDSDEGGDGYHVYALYDPTRPDYRKTGKTTKSKEHLITQYNPRNYPEEVEIIAFADFADTKGMEAAEKHLQNNILKDYRHTRDNGYETEWVKLPSDWDEEKKNKYCKEAIENLF